MSAAASVLEECCAAGVVLVADGAELRIGAKKGTLSPALRTRIVTHKRELLGLLCRGQDARASDFERAVRAWSADVLTLLARGRGYPDEIIEAACRVLSKQPRQRTFTVGRDVIVVEIGDGMEVRLHRTPQPWVGGGRP